MAIRASSFSEETRTSQRQPSTIDWEWSIRPLIIWLRIIGVDLPSFSNSSTQCNWRRLLILVYMSFCFLFHVSCHINIIHYMYPLLSRASAHNQTDDLPLVETTTAIWNTIIDLANYAVHGIGIHLMLLTVFHVRWIDTMDTFQRLHPSIFTEENYIHIRKITVYGVIYIILLIAVLVAVTIEDNLELETRSTRSFFVTITWIVSIIYPLTTIIFFVVHCYASSLAFELIRKEIKRRELELINCRDRDETSFLLDSIKHKHLIACDAVDSINGTFGRMLLLSITYFIVAFVNASYFMYSLVDAVTIASVSFLMYTFSNLPLICFAADRISNKAEDMIRELMRLKCADEPLKGHQMEIEFLILDTAQTIPQIYANGYFKVSKRLLPQVIGTTLTYFFILCQFEASEKKKPEDN